MPIENADPALDAELVSDAFLHDPYPTMRRMQTEAPVYWSETIGAWIVTRYDDVVVTFRDFRHYSNEGRLGQAVAYLPSEQRANFGPFEAHYATKSLIHSDPPDHTRLRGLLNQAFTPRVIEGMRTRIQALVAQLLDDAPAAGPLDLIRQLASPLPAIVIAEIMGAPVADAWRFKGWADDILAFQGLNRPPVPTLERSQRGIIEIRAYLADLIDERRRQPREDLLSHLVSVEAQGQRLSPTELLSSCVTLLVAGHETTMSLIGNGLFTLLRHPEQLADLRQHPELLPGAIEEMLRYESPVARQPRRLPSDVVMGGQQLHEGQMVMQFVNAANRDEAYFPDPDRFDVRRANNRHIAFGLGIHLCIGAPLARLEGPIAIAEVLARMPNLQLGDDRPDWDITKPNSRLLHSLVVTN